MKRILPILLTVCLLAALFTALTVNSGAAEDVQVTVGQKFEWNDQSADSNTQKAWRLGGGKSPDGMWEYMFYSLAKKVYGHVVLSSDGFAWSKTPGDTGIGYARARGFGKNFHPGEAADIVKVFNVPSGGTITVDTIIKRVNEWVAGTNTATSLAVFLDSEQVFPAGGGVMSIVSATEQTYTFDVDVKKGQRLYIHIGCIDGNQSGDAVEMANYVTYKSVNDEVAESTEIVPPPKPVETIETVIVCPGPQPYDEGSSVGLIIGIVAAVVVVIGVVVAVIVIKKKKA